MMDGSMFANLLKYGKTSIDMNFYKKSPTFTVTTPDDGDEVRRVGDEIGTFPGLSGSAEAEMAEDDDGIGLARGRVDGRLDAGEEILAVSASVEVIEPVGAGGVEEVLRRGEGAGFRRRDADEGDAGRSGGDDRVGREDAFARIRDGVCHPEVAGDDGETATAADHR